jgi:hypothetical protein
LVPDGDLRLHRRALFRGARPDPYSPARRGRASPGLGDRYPTPHGLVRDNVNASQPDGATALHWAVHWEHVEMTGRLIGAGADVNVHNDLGMFPLLMAGRAGNATLVQHLLAAGADPDQSLEGGETALMAAARVGRPRGRHPPYSPTARAPTWPRPPGGKAR